MRRLAKEVEDLKSVVSLLAMAPDRAQAATWASELEKNGFAHHSVDEIKKSLQVSSAPCTLSPLLTHDRTRQLHGLLSRIKTLTVLRGVNNSQAMAIISCRRRTIAHRGKKGKTIASGPSGRN